MYSHREQDVIYKLIFFKLRHKPYAFDENDFNSDRDKCRLSCSLNPIIVIHLMMSRARMSTIKTL